jgi:hypothetical protein
MFGCSEEIWIKKKIRTYSARNFQKHVLHEIHAFSRASWRERWYYCCLINWSALNLDDLEYFPSRWSCCRKHDFGYTKIKGNIDDHTLQYQDTYHETLFQKDCGLDHD